MTVKRAYDASRRRSQAEARRRSVLDAARRQFVEFGITGTTIGGIAEAAGVSSQTVYAVFGSKGGLLIALLDQLEAEVDSPGYASAIDAAAGDAGAQLELIVRYHCELFDRGLDVIDLARRSSSDPVVGGFVDEGNRRRRDACVRWARSWRKSGVLRGDVTVTTAADLLWVYCGADLFAAFVLGCGWDRARLERWLVPTLRSLLLEVS
jgi:AcrR family transcriptional regulator